MIILFNGKQMSAEKIVKQGDNLVGYNGDDIAFKLTKISDWSVVLGLDFDLSTLVSPPSALELKGDIQNNKDYLAITAPTSAQNTAQIKKMARQLNRLLRLQINEFSEVD